ncbi:MAG: O-methyltransferase [Bacteroidota bacterium]
MIGLFRLITGYIFYWFKSVGRHGLQSSFLYNLNEAVWRFDKKHSSQLRIEHYREACLKNSNLLEVKDFGAGVHGNKYKKLSVSSIAKNAAKPPKYARMLFRLMEYLKPQTVIELGTSLGISSLYISSGNPTMKLISLEGCDHTTAYTREQLKQFPDLTIELITGNFDDTFLSVLKSEKKIDAIYIDGNHRYEPTMRYFEMCLPYMHENSFIIFDDINWSEEMKKAWKDIIIHPAVSISIDVYMMGIVFFNTGFSKQNFQIRY